MKINSPLISSSKIELDLTFIGPSDDLLEEFLDQSTKTFLTKSDHWEEDLKCWIQFMRSNKSLYCPEAVLQSTHLSMGLEFTDDETVQALNAAWRQTPQTTDVLSFPVLDDMLTLIPSLSVELGDIVVSLTTAQIQAKEQNHSLIHELRWLVSHGLLHLLGWDHPTSHSLHEMLCCQEQLLCIEGNL